MNARPTNARTRIAERGYWLDRRSEHLFDEPLARKLRELFAGATVVDLGCGAGAYVMFLRSAGIHCDGYDGNPFAPDLSGGIVGVRDLSVDFDLGQRFDWVLSLEVGEHIPATYEAAYLRNVERHCRRGVVLSWALEGQPGRGHVNCHTNDYVREKFREMGFADDLRIEHTLRRASELPWFARTLMVFERAARDVR